MTTASDVLMWSRQSLVTGTISRHNRGHFATVSYRHRFLKASGSNSSSRNRRLGKGSPEPLEIGRVRRRLLDDPATPSRFCSVEDEISQEQMVQVRVPKGPSVTEHEVRT
jgi:hypothetical protein